MCDLRAALCLAQKMGKSLVGSKILLGSLQRSEKGRKEPSMSEANLKLSAAEIRVILAGPLLAMFLAALDQTIIAPALPTMARELGGFSDLSWVVSSYLLASTAVTPIYGKLSDLFGRRNLLLIAIGIFVFGSVLCALAPNMLMLVLARAVQGIGGGGLLSLPNTVIADVVSPRDRGKYQGYFAAVYALSGIGGPVLGGVMTEYLSWTLVFWINVPMGLFAALVSFKALSHVKTPKRQHRIDYVGSILMVLATLSFLFALTSGGHRYEWLSYEILGLFGLSFILTGLFIRSQFMADEPILPMRLMQNPIVRLTSFIGLIIIMVNASVSIYVPLWLELTRQMRPDEAGLVLIAPMLSIVFGAVISGQYMRLTGRYKLPPTLGFAAGSLILFGFAYGAETLPLIWALVLLAIFGLGLGTGFPALMVATQNAVEPREVGTATGTQAFFRSLGGAIGVSMFGAILLASLSVHGDAALALRQAEGSAQIHHAFSVLFGVAGLVMAIGALSLARLREIPLRQEVASPHAVASGPVQNAASAAEKLS